VVVVVVVVGEGTNGSRMSKIFAKGLVHLPGTKVVCDDVVVDVVVVLQFSIILRISQYFSSSF
jgi:hypothetical protein